ncbi:MAG: pentapeptide repeat-containing protein [Proteobacteria bacterium]|nr:pentapeptide repeat-containing protein [Pseudomonadota bacterium]
MEYSFIGTIFVLCFIAFMIGKDVRRWQDFGIVEDYKERGKLALLKPMYIGVGLIIFIPLVILFFSLLDDIADIPTNKTITPSEVRNLAIAFVGTITGIGALFAGYLAILRSEENKRQNDVAEEQSKTAIQQSKIANAQSKAANAQSKAANRQADIAEQGLITDRINKAVENLGKSKNDIPVIEVRIGALYALERIAKDSERDHVQIVEIFCAYIRTNSSNDDKKIIKNPLRDDIQEALTIIGRRETWSKGKSRLEIERIQGMRLNFFNCYLKEAELYFANLSHANFYKANLQDAWLNGVDLSRARLIDADITDADLTDAKTSGAHAQNGDFSGCKTLNQEQIDKMFLGKEVVLRKGLNHPQKDPKYDKIHNNQIGFMKAYYEWLDETGY